MQIDFDAGRWERVKRVYGSWWDGTLERPLINVSVYGYEPTMPRPELPLYGFASFYGLDTPAERIVDTWQWDLEGQRFPGDAFPAVWPNYGPGTLAAFLGCELHTSIEGNTTWFHPREVREAADLRFVLDENETWFRRVREVMQAADARFGGMVQIGMPDLGGNLDVVASFRPGELLLLDLYDCPEEVERLAWETHEQWFACFERLKAAVPHNPGYTAWTAIFSEDPYYMLQCDFSYMIGPDMFDRFAKPELAACCRRLRNGFYHLDGPGELPHLDSLLAIPELKGVQWVPGAGQPDITHWPEVYRKIRQAGKRIQFFTSQAECGIEALDILADQLGSAEGLVMVGGVQRRNEDKLAALLERHGAG